MTILKWLLSLLFVAAGVMHFVRPEFYVGIMPPWLPWHLELVYFSGLIEIVLGVMLIVPRLRRVAAWGIIALLITVFPANVHMAVNSHLYPYPPPVLWARLPLQGAFIAWAWYFTQRKQSFL